MTSASISVLLVEQNRLLREGLKHLLPANRFSICAEINSLADTWALLERTGDSLRLAIYSMSDCSADEFDTIKAITAQYPKLLWIVLAPKRDPRLLKLAVHCGVSGVLSKDISPEALCNCVELILLGERIFPSSTAFFEDATAALEQETPDGGDDTQNALPTETIQLSENQKTTLAYVMKGVPNKVIAREMGIAEATVKVHLKALMKKLDAHNRTQVAILGLRGSVLTSTTSRRLPEDSPATESGSEARYQATKMRA